MDSLALDLTQSGLRMQRSAAGKPQISAERAWKRGANPGRGGAMSQLWAKRAFDVRMLNSESIFLNNYADLKAAHAPSQWAGRAEFALGLGVCQVDQCACLLFPRWFLFYPLCSMSGQRNKDLTSPPHWSLWSQTLPVDTGAKTTLRQCSHQTQTQSNHRGVLLHRVFLKQIHVSKQAWVLFICFPVTEPKHWACTGTISETVSGHLNLLLVNWFKELVWLSQSQLSSLPPKPSNMLRDGDFFAWKVINHWFY